MVSLNQEAGVGFGVQIDFNDEVDDRSLRNKRHQHPLPENREGQAPLGAAPRIDRERSLLDSFGARSRTCRSGSAGPFDGRYDCGRGRVVAGRHLRNGSIAGLLAANATAISGLGF